MATTNFASLTTEELKLWSMDTWAVARRRSFWEQFTGTDENAALQRISEFKADRKGAKAVITLTPDLSGNGVIGDQAMTGNEEAMVAYDWVFQVDQQRNAVKLAGRMSDQKSIVDFRKKSRNALGYWLADMRDRLITLKLSGVAFNKRLDGTTITFNGAPDTLTNLSFATAVAPSSKRKLYLGASAAITDGLGTDAAAGTLRDFTYDDIVKLQALAKTRGIKPVRGSGGMEAYHLVMHPSQLARLKLDSNFIQNVRHAGIRGDKNSLFQGTPNSVLVDGVMIHETLYCYNTLGAASGSRMGATGVDHGARALLLGAQAGAIGDIGDMEWTESDVNDYGNQPGIAISKIWGVDKPQFKGSWDDSANLQDFGIITVDAKIA
jgi:N4-gp56 family major capsid protein